MTSVSPSWYRPSGQCPLLLAVAFFVSSRFGGNFTGLSHLGLSIRKRHGTIPPMKFTSVPIVNRWMIIGVITAVGIAGLLSGCGRTGPPLTPKPSPPATHVEARQLTAVESAVRDAIDAGHTPGAVVLIGTSKQDLYRRAFGFRARKPEPIPMTVDTVFDLASLTKVVATAAAVMILQQEKQLAIDDPAAKYFPEFAANGKKTITIEQLLLHTSGLVPDNPLNQCRGGWSRTMTAICSLAPRTPPGSTFAYSDVGYMVLAEIVQRITKQPFSQFVADRILTPLGMTDAGFNPAGDQLARCAPTEQRDGRWIVGQVHDPRAHLLGGVAGHAGLFATADDLARFCRMILNYGQLDGQRPLAPETVAAMIRPRSAGNKGALRALGWDVSSRYASARGYGFELGRSFGHTGFTGTSIWIDPDRDCFVVILTNRLHPDGQGSVIPLRRTIATIAANAIQPVLHRKDAPSDFVTIHRDPNPPPEGTPVLAGVDVLARSGFKPLKGRRVGLIANHTSVDHTGKSTIQLLHEAPDVHLAAMFSPEHGLAGELESHVPDAVHKDTGLRIFSLYGQTKRPTPEMLEGIDTLVFDIQDIGTRFYTYITTMRYAMEAAANAGIRFVVLDRPNPITGTRLFGPVADEGRQSFTCPHPLPLVHGRTVGELAWLFNRQRDIRVDLHVVAASGWNPGLWFDQTRLPWINPSPNIRNLTQATLYPAVCLLEPTNMSVGRGSDTPFEHFGAPWLNNEDLVDRLNTVHLPGVSFQPDRFTPTTSVFAGRSCNGVALQLTDRNAFDPMRTGLTIVASIHQLYGDTFKIDRVDRLLVSRSTLDEIKQARPVDDVVRDRDAQLAAIRRIYQNYRIYP